MAGEKITDSGTPSAKNASGSQKDAAPNKQATPTPEMIAQIAKSCSRVRESFGSIAMAMMMLPQYRNQTVADLQHLVLDPLVRDRIAIAYPANTDTPGDADMVGFAIWATVSDTVDARIRDQIKAGTTPSASAPTTGRPAPKTPASTTGSSTSSPRMRRRRRRCSPTSASSRRAAA